MYEAGRPLSRRHGPRRQNRAACRRRSTTFRVGPAGILVCWRARHSPEATGTCAPRSSFSPLG